MNIYDEMDAMDVQRYVGVDALTLTAKTQIGAVGILAAIRMLESRLEIEDTKPFKIHGASGWTKGPVAFAQKVNHIGKALWSIMMVRGPLAQEVMAFKIFDLKATRVDLRVDVKLSKPYLSLAEKSYRLAMTQGKRDCKLIQSLTGDTFYPDVNREATYYGRLYDKSAEYGEDKGTVWRYEVEIKRYAAEQVAEMLMEVHELERFVEQTVFGIFAEKWETPVPGKGIYPKLNYVGISAVTTDAKLDWLKRNVAPSVRKLQSLGLTADVIEALGLTPGVKREVSIYRQETMFKDNNGDGEGI